MVRPRRPVIKWVISSASFWSFRFLPIKPAVITNVWYIVSWKLHISLVELLQPSLSIGRLFRRKLGGCLASR